MFSVEWDQEDLNDLVVDLDALYPEELAGKELPHWSMEVMQDVMAYPPPKKDSTYVRTGNLLAGWKRAIKPKQVRIFNPVDYGIWVQGREQITMHAATGWKRLHEWAEKHMERLIYKLEMKALGIWDT